jgi:hypothetical protein
VEAAGGTWQTRRSITFSSFAPRYVWSIPNINALCSTEGPPHRFNWLKNVTVAGYIGVSAEFERMCFDIWIATNVPLSEQRIHSMDTNTSAE